MIIQSKEKDYYDSAAGFGIDTTIFYNRNDKNIISSNQLKSELPVIYSNWVNLDSHLLPKDKIGIKHFSLMKKFIGFCGKIYPIVHTWGFVESKMLANSINGVSTDEKFFYSSDKLKEFLKGYEVTSRNQYRQSPYYFKQFEELEALDSINHDQLFIKLKTPIFIGSKDDHQRGLSVVSTNEILKFHQFAKVKPPIEAFQEIAMYLTNQLVPRDEIDQVNDSYRLAGHGFDKHSFRHPTKLKDLY